MKITIVSTWDIKGGASIAAFRLHDALKHEGHKVNMLVNSKSSNSDTVFTPSFSKVHAIKSFLRFSYERFIFKHYQKDKSLLFTFSIANTGMDISKHILIKQANIINLHWFNFGFLSLSALKKLFALNKPIVWTLHDMWAFTGGCHYTGNCTKFLTECNNCPYLKKPSDKELSYKIFNKKLTLFKNQKNLIFATCSNWLKNEAEKSALISKFPIYTVPNAIDTDTFKPFADIVSLKKRLGLKENKKYILFGAANINEKRKGFHFLLESLELLEKTLNKNETIIFGKNQKENKLKMPFFYREVGSLDSVMKLIQFYSIANIFILPSIQDNLPNTVVESMACGTPVVAFNSGGVTDLIDHKIAEFGLDRLLKSMKNIKVFEPLGYIDFQKLMTNSMLVVTDSGGIQGETTALKIPCITIRANTERPIMITQGSNEIVGDDFDKLGYYMQKAIIKNWKKSSIPELWDGKTSERIIRLLKNKP